MTKTTRYGLIIAWLCTFFIVAPVLVLYIQGKAINVKNRNTELTGIISVKTIPNSADIKVGNEPSVKSPNAIRFLKAGDYDISVSKTGYKTWHKTLNVIAGKVTYANSSTNPIRLIKDTREAQVTREAKAYANINNKILYSTENMLVLFNPKSEQTFTLDTPNTITKLTPDNSGTYILASGPTFTGVINIDAWKMINLTKITQGDQHIYLEDGMIYSLSQSGTLTAFPAEDLTKQTVLASNISNFLVQGNEIYYLSIGKNTNTLHHGTISGLTIVQDQILANDIPITKVSTIFADAKKAIYLLLDGNLWRINGKLELVEENVTSANTNSGTLAFTKPGELSWYESGSNKVHLVTRTTHEFHSYYINPSLDYAFFVEKNKIVALELDDRSGQNRYDLVSSQEQLSHLLLADATHLFYMSGTGIYSIQVFEN